MVDWDSSGLWLGLVPALLSGRALAQALCARLVGYRVSSFGLGSGRVRFRRRVGRSSVVYFTPWLLTGARCGMIPAGGLESGRRTALISLAGLAAMVAILIGVLLILPEFTWRSPGLIGSLCLIGSFALPWRLGGVVSDGWRIQRALRFHQPGAWPGAARRAIMERFSATEARVGSQLGSRYARLVLAWMDLQLGRTCLPEIITRHAPQSGPERRLDALHEYVLASWHLLAKRPLAALQVIRAARERGDARFEAAGQELLRIVEARTWLSLDEPAAAHRALSALVGSGGVLAREAMVLRLELALAGGSIAEIRSWALRVGELVSSGVLEPVNAVRVLREAATALASADWQAASNRVSESAGRLARSLQGSVAPVDRLALSTVLQVSSPCPKALG